MQRKYDTTTLFNYKKEEGLNPYIGFVSFQHFRGGKLYSDSVVRPENNRTETEAFECYPVSADVEENGREQGYYPDSTVAYIRVLWKEFEPERGVYNFKFIEDIINEAKSHGQTLIFRLMPHSTREREDVPEWLKELVKCPRRPDGERVKDSPTEPLFIDLFCEAVSKIGERFDDEPVFDAIDISMPGAWGEGHNLHLYSQETLKKIVDTYIDVFKKTQIIAQMARTELISYASETVPVGWRGDGLGHPEHTEKFYPPCVEKMKDVWKNAPVSFESYWWLGEWMRQGWDIDEIIDKTLEWHISSFNAKSLPIPYEWKEKVDYWISRMGYHYSFEYFKYSHTANQADTLNMELCVFNHGVAPIYRKIPVKIRLSGSENSYEFDTDIDARKWLPGESKENIDITLPVIPPGKYKIELGMYNDIIPLIYFCTDAERNGSFYRVGEIEIY